MYTINKIKYLFVFVSLIFLIVFLFTYIKENKTSSKNVIINNSDTNKVSSYGESNNILNYLKLEPKSMQVMNNTFVAQGNFIQFDKFQDKSNSESYQELPKFPLVIDQFDIICDLKTKKCTENTIQISRSIYHPDSVHYGDNRYSVRYSGSFDYKYVVLSNNLVKKEDGYEGSLTIEKNFEPLECGRYEIIFNFTNDSILQKRYSNCSGDGIENNIISSEIFAE